MKCPRCHKELHKNGHQKDGKQRWACKSGHSYTKKEDYSPRTKRMIEWWNM